MTEDVYLQSARQFYDDEDVAKRVASVARRTFKKPTPAAPKVLRPKPTACLGKLLSLEIIKRSGRLEVHQWTVSTAPKIFWSEELQGYCIFPEAPVRKTSMTLTPLEGLNVTDKKAKRASARWNRRWGKPGGIRRMEVNIPTEPIRFQGACVRVVYRSPFGKADDWQHFQDPGVCAWASKGSPPSVILVRGGRLKMTSRGLEH